MAVAVAADPGGKPQQRRHSKRLPRIELGQGLPQVLQHLRHHFPQHGHDAQPALHLLVDRGQPGADEVGLPELGQFRLELQRPVPPPRAAAGPVRPIRCSNSRNRRSLARIERRLASVGCAVSTSSTLSRSSSCCRSAAGKSVRRQLGDRRPDRLGPRRRMRRPLPLPQHPHPLPILRHVHQVQTESINARATTRRFTSVRSASIRVNCCSASGRPA